MQNVFACFDSPNFGGSKILILATDLFTAPLQKLTHFHSVSIFTLNLNNVIMCKWKTMERQREAKACCQKWGSEWTSSQTLLLSKLKVMSKWQKNLFLPKNPEKWFWIRMKDDFVSQEKGREHHSARPKKKNILWLRYTNDILISCDRFSKGNSMSTQNSQLCPSSNCDS